MSLKQSLYFFTCTSFLLLSACSITELQPETPSTNQDGNNEIEYESTTEESPYPIDNASSQWLSYNKRLDGQRFSNLSQITPENAHQLGQQCSVQIDGPTSFSSGLIVADGIIYANTGWVTAAVDATNCAVKWMHRYQPEDDVIIPSSRGPALMNGKIFRGTGDGRLIALDAETGELVWKNIIGSPRLSEFASSAPLAWQGVVYMGVAGGDRGIRGRVMAFDAETGKELWRFNTIPMGEETGAETWEKPETALTGGGGVWGAMSLDVTTGELFVPVGNPWPDIATDYRPGDNLFTNSIVVLDANTGKLKWWYQALAEDAHDLDLSGAPVLYRDSSIRDRMTFGGKDGYVVSIDRASHEPLFKTAVTTIKNAGAPATEEGTHICPGFAGGMQWNGPTLDRNNNLLISGVVDWCMTIFSGPVEYAPPEVSYGGYPVPDDNPTGAVVALDAESGEIKWRYQAERPVIAGITPTSSGITFTGDLAGNLLVLNSGSGELLNKIQTQGALAGGVVTYEISGKQYVAAASGNVSRNTFGVLGLPSIVIMTLNPEEKDTSHIERNVEINETLTTPDSLKGNNIFTNICSACHGADGNSLAEHRLSQLLETSSFEEIAAYIKNPTLPMPEMYPSLLSAKDVNDVTAYIVEVLNEGNK